MLEAKKDRIKVILKELKSIIKDLEYTRFPSPVYRANKLYLFWGNSFNKKVGIKI